MESFAVVIKNEAWDSVERVKLDIQKMIADWYKGDDEYDAGPPIKITVTVEEVK